MTVHELILKLEQLDRFTEVVVNMPNDTGEGLWLSPIQDVSEIETDSEEKYILLDLIKLHGTTDISQN